MITLSTNSEMGSKNIQTTLISNSAPPCGFALGEIFGRSKSKEAFESQCSSEKIVQFFKCSRRLCDFTCDDKERFYFHLLTHNEDEEQDVCVYCERMFVIENLARHMEAQHGNRRFQCKMCFYRGCTRAHLIVHCVKQHNLQFVTGIACPRMPGALMPDVKARARTLLYRCSLCTFRSFGRDDFERHLSTAHPETTAVDHSAENGFRQAADRRSPGSARLYCVYCHSVGEQKSPPDARLYSANELIIHLDEEHRLGNRLTCLYCGEALQTENALSHMTELHSDWPINILDRNTKSGSRIWSVGNAQCQIATASHEINTSPKKYSAAPRSVQEKRQRKLSGGITATTAPPLIQAGVGGPVTAMSSVGGELLSRPSTSSSATFERIEKLSPKPRSILKKKALSLSANAFSAAPDLILELPQVLRCASCTDPGATIDYLSQEALALHMRHKHNVYYICQRCFHGEEKFRLIQAHVAQCDGATELDIVTLKNGVLKTSSKVRSTQKERQQHAAAAVSVSHNQNNRVTSQSENRCAQAQSVVAAGRDAAKGAGSSRDMYVLLNDIPKGPFTSPEDVGNNSINGSSGSVTSKTIHTHRVSSAHTQSDTETCDDADTTASAIRTHDSTVSLNRKRDRGVTPWASRGRSSESVANNNLVVIYQDARISLSRFEQLAGRSYTLVKRLCPKELGRWGII